MKARLLLTGHGGFVAGSVLRQAGQEWDVYAVSRSAVPEQRAGFRGYQFDLRDSDKLRETFAEVEPHVVIHTAALANIDYCETHQDEAEQINAGATEALARCCGEANARMVFCSTDSLFDGVKGMYCEEDAPNPVNFYAETKVRAEEAVRRYVESGVVARLSLVMGLPVLGAGNSFLANMITALRMGNRVNFPANEVRTPVDVITLGQALLELAGCDFTGTIHLGGNTRLNRYDMGCRIAERLGYPTDLIVGTNSNALAGRAPRPNDASLDNALARRVLDTPMRSLMDGLDLVLSAEEK